MVLLFRTNRMADSNEVTPIEINDKAFLIASTIERCPKVMMLRELMMNALEAASSAPAGKRRVEVSAKLLNGVPKLTIWNTGPGMDGHQLHEMCDLSSTIGKRKGLDENFGMGAKVASLPSNRHGMRYRSSKGGVVNEVILCERGGVYGRLRPLPPYRSFHPSPFAYQSWTQDHTSHEVG